MPTYAATPSSGRTALGDAVVMEAITRLESEGPLDDRLELRQAFRSQPTRAGQVTERAWLLGERLGFTQALAQWRQAAKWMLIALALLMALLALGSARAIVGPERSINAVAAFVGLLGLHFVTLVLWLLGVLWSVWGHRSSAGGLSLGRLALSLAARLPVDRSPHALLLLRSATAVLQRARLWIWLTGALSHGIWVMAFALVLAALAFGFAFHAYALNWETTILSPTFFQRFVQITGALPAQLGFPVPDAAVVAQGGPSGVAQPGSASQAPWAWWLMGCVLVWGLLPRAGLALLSWACWRAGVARLAHLDMTDPEVRRHVARLDALEPPPQVLDPEVRIDAHAPIASRGAGAPGAPGSLAVVGYELPPESPWPPGGLDPSAGGTWRRVSGSHAEREAALAELAAQRPESLLLVVHAPASPDRGTARFVREAAGLAQRTALWPLAVDGAEHSGEARWRTWLASEGFEALALVHQAPDAIDWIANVPNHHD